MKVMTKNSENTETGIFDNNVLASNVVFLTLDSFDGNSSIKQHIFKPKIYTTKWIGEEYEGNISLCGKIKASTDEDKYSLFEELKKESEKLNNSNCCKKCLDIYDLLDLSKS